MFKTNVNPYRLLFRIGRFYIYLAGEGDVPVAGGILSEGAGFDFAYNWTGHVDPDAADCRKLKFLAGNRRASSVVAKSSLLLNCY